MSFETLKALADRAALFTALRQDQLSTASDELGEHRWDVDLSARTFTFSSVEDPTRTLEATPHLIASIAPGPRSLMWAWALPQGDASGVSERLRAYGEQNGIPALTQGEVAFPDDTGDDLERWVAELAHTIGGAVAEITGMAPYYSAPVGGGTRALLMLDAPLPPLTIASVLPALPRMLSGLTLPDARTSVWDLGRLAGWQLTWADQQFSAAELTDATGSATFTFDEYARITGVKGSTGSGAA